ncbi:MAG TPA: 3-oxoacyl-[acyl-carrier-protein] synthase III C-terminal domain-containing protein [Actinocrinis sp.]|nr:3-oxoacyl-[acyl-carrier-protein] synthase III C-terminal domain-containing protein [Actinocrinis sp.]
MTALEAVGVYVPSGRVPVDRLAEHFGLSTMRVQVFQRSQQFEQESRSPDSGLLELLRGAVADLDGLRGREDRVRYVVHARTFPVVVSYPQNPLRELCFEFGLEQAATFAVGHHASASGLLAVDVAGRLLTADSDPEALALVVAGEKALARQARATPESGFFGEGAAACLIRAEGTHDRLLAYATELRGEFDDDSAGTVKAFHQQYTDCLAAAILTAVERCGLDMDAISLILPHSVDRMAWQLVCQRLGFPLERVVLDNAASVGHLFCADAFVSYRTARTRGLLRPGDRYVMAAAGAGLGAAFSAMVFEH